MTESASTTLTTRFAAIQLKMLHLQFRMKKIHQDQQKALSEAQHKTNRDRVRGLLPVAYNFIDMLVTFEHAAGLVRDIFATPELRVHFDKDTYEILNRTRKAAEKCDRCRRHFRRLHVSPRPLRRGEGVLSNNSFERSRTVTLQ